MKTRAMETGDAARLLLIASIAFTVLLDVVPFGYRVRYPLLLVATVVHESGHGITGMLVGCHWDSLEVFSDGSGLAHCTACPGHLASGLLSAGGLCGPAVCGLLFFLLGSRTRVARVALGVVGALLLVGDALLVRSLFGVPFVALLGVVALWIARRGSPETAQLVLLFFAVQLSLNVFSMRHYLFTDVAHTAGGTFPSDVANMSTYLSMPYWFWGAVCGSFSLLTMALGVWVFFRATRVREGTLRGRG